MDLTLIVLDVDERGDGEGKLAVGVQLTFDGETKRLEVEYLASTPEYTFEADLLYDTVGSNEVGVVSQDDHERLKAAIEQIRHITFVASVTNHVVERTG